MPTAHAADNANLVLGSATNTVEHLTVLSYDGSETAPTVFKVTTSVANSLGVYGTAGNWNSAISAGVGGIAGAGASAIGVNAKAGTSGTGARGVAKGFGAYGVWGINDAGVGVQGDSNTGVDLAATGLGRVYQFPQVFDGPPTTGSYLVGEQIRDINGNLLICVASGTPGTWRKVAAVAPGAGGIVYLLSAPIRLLDTRNGIGMFPAGSTNILQVTGVDIGGISVPKGATGVVGNVTVVSPTAGGDLRLYPGGATAPNTSSINFATGQVIANGVTVGLNVTGQISIKVDLPAGKATHVIFDASGYVM